VIYLIRENPIGGVKVVEQIPNYGDERQLAWCVYCGGPTETRDHVPSKVLLDEPYPSNLPVVPACVMCNTSFSVDEEYVACLVGCVLAGSTTEQDIKREKVRRILREKVSLATRMGQARVQDGIAIRFLPEYDRVENVVLKLARGHEAFELNEPQIDAPSSMAFLPLSLMDAGDRARFETPPWSSVWPEVGSRAMQRLIRGGTSTPGWVIAQEGRYRYLTALGDGVVIRFVLSEYLACEVTWD
jgi:hypothetical protein